MRILILEDDPLIGLDLQIILEDCGHEVIGPCATVADGRSQLAGAIDFALLDVDLLDGKSYGLAATLIEQGVPFAFVSGSHRSDLPEHLREAGFIAKPYHQAAIRNSLDGALKVAC